MKPDVTQARLQPHEDFQLKIAWGSFLPSPTLLKRKNDESSSKNETVQAETNGLQLISYVKTLLL